MPRLSAFTPLGLLRCSAKPSEAQNIYEALITSLGGNYDVSHGGRMDGFCYALAIRLARARLKLIHAGLQISPLNVTEMMSDREAEWQITPGPFDTLETRRSTLAAREKLPRGARREAIEDLLQTLLGDAFVWYYTTKKADIATWPLTLGDPAQNLQNPSIPRKRLTITQSVSVGLGAPQTVAYTMSAGSSALIGGDELSVDPGNITRTETVTVTAVTPTTFTATFNNPHDVDSPASTMPFPIWCSNQRDNAVIVDAVTAVDPEARRKINEIMSRALRAVSTWAIVAETSAGTAGPFRIGVSPIGATPFGIVTFP